MEEQIRKLKREAKRIRETLEGIVDAREKYRKTAAYFGSTESQDSKFRVLSKDANVAYSTWSGLVLQLVEDYLPRHKKAFVEYSNKVMTYLSYDIVLPYDKRVDKNDLYYSFDRQLGILDAVPRSVQLKEAELRALISSEFVQDELAQAEVLLQRKYLRCAGLLSGIALERHLQDLCRARGVDAKGAGGITALAQRLYKSQVIDKVQLASLEHLAAIRNTCAHADTETSVKEQHVSKLFQQVSAIVLIR